MSFIKRWKNSNTYIATLLIPITLFLGLICFFYFGASNTQDAANQENLKYLENAVRKATIQCYAIEGIYPPNSDYLEENYGIIIDHKKYAVHYSAFASNIMPDITVLDLTGSGGDFID